MKTDQQIAKNRDTEDRKAKERARAGKTNRVNGSELCKLLRRQPLKKRAGWKMAQVKSVKKSHSEERKQTYIRESSHTK